METLEEEIKTLRKKYKHRGNGCSDIELQVYKDKTNKLIKELEEENYYLNMQLDAFMGPHMQTFYRRKRAAYAHFQQPTEAGQDQVD